MIKNKKTTELKLEEIEESKIEKEKLKEAELKKELKRYEEEELDATKEIDNFLENFAEKSTALHYEIYEFECPQKKLIRNTNGNLIIVEKLSLIEKLKKEIRDIKANIDKYKNFKDLQNEYNELEQKITKAKEEYEYLNKKSDELNKEIARYSRRVDENPYDTIYYNLTKGRWNPTFDSTTNGKLEEKIYKAKRNIEYLYDNFREEKNKYDFLKQKHEIVKNTYKKFKEEKKKYEKELSITKYQNKETLRKIRINLDKKREEYDSLEKRNEVIKSELRYLKNKINLRKKRNELINERYKEKCEEFLKEKEKSPTDIETSETELKEKLKEYEEKKSKAIKDHEIFVKNIESEKSKTKCETDEILWMPGKRPWFIDTNDTQNNINDPKTIENLNKVDILKKEIRIIKRYIDGYKNVEELQNEYNNLEQKIEKTKKEFDDLTKEIIKYGKEEERCKKEILKNTYFKTYCDYMKKRAKEKNGELKNKIDILEQDIDYHYDMIQNEKDEYDFLKQELDIAKNIYKKLEEDEKKYAKQRYENNIKNLEIF